MKSLILNLVVVGCVLVAICWGQTPAPAQPIEPDTYPDGKAGCCTQGGGIPMGFFCIRPDVECRCCTSAGNRNCYPVNATTARCGKNTRSCDLKKNTMF